MQTQTILIVEDTSFEQKLLAGIVSKLGFHYLICGNGLEAITLLKEQHAVVDLMLLDLNMPVIDGISTLGHCKAHYPDLPIIIVTSSEDADDLAQTEKWGADALIRKPVELGNMKTVIESVLRSNRSGMRSNENRG